MCRVVKCGKAYTYLGLPKEAPVPGLATILGFQDGLTRSEEETCHASIESKRSPRVKHIKQKQKLSKQKHYKAKALQSKSITKQKHYKAKALQSKSITKQKHYKAKA
jgi:hypothetical protein